MYSRRKSGRFRGAVNKSSTQEAFLGGLSDGLYGFGRNQHCTLNCQFAYPLAGHGGATFTERSRAPLMLDLSGLPGPSAPINRAAREGCFSRLLSSHHARVIFVSIKGRGVSSMIRPSTG